MKGKSRHGVQRPWIALALLVIAGGAGFAGGRWRAIRARDTTMAEKGTSTLATTEKVMKEAGSDQPAAIVQHLVQRLRKMAHGSPDAEIDLAMQAEARAILDLLPADMLADVFRELADHKNETAIAVVRQLALDAWARKDGRAAMEAWEKCEHEDVWFHAFGEWAKLQPREALLWLREARKSWEATWGDGLPDHVLFQVARRDRAVAEEEFSRMSDSEKSVILSDAAEAWATDPGLREWVMAMASHSGEEERVRRFMIRSWAGTQPDGALTYLSSLDVSDEERKELEESAVEGQARTDPRAALEGWFARHGGYEDFSEGGSILYSWGARSLEDAEAWFKSLPPDQQKQLDDRGYGDPFGPDLPTGEGPPPPRARDDR